ncbi:hypothetical protein UT300012_22750 [Paraclostridium bifermentans]
MYNDSIKRKINLKVDKVRVDKVKSYIEESDKYSIEDYLKSINQFDDSNMKTQSDNYFISCPFHSDGTPSFSLNTNRNIFKCFGCGRGGGYIALVREWEKFNGRFVDDEIVAERLLREDKAMAHSLGFATIYERDNKKVDFSNFKINRPEKRNLLDYEPTTFLALAHKMNKDKRSNRDKVMMISLMQSGMEIKDVYKVMYDKAKKAFDEPITLDKELDLSKNEFDIDSILATV